MFRGERSDVRLMPAQEGFDHGRGAITGSNPNHFRRVAEEEAALMEIGIFGHDREAMLNRILPDRVIAGRAEIGVAHMLGVGVVVLQGGDESIRQVVIEEQLHEGGRDTSFRSRSAAKARQARMSSRVRSGKSFRMFSSLMPEARYSSTSYTVMRNPRMQGLPPRLPGSIVMRCSQFMSDRVA